MAPRRLYVQSTSLRSVLKTRNVTLEMLLFLAWKDFSWLLHERVRRWKDFAFVDRLSVNRARKLMRRRNMFTFVYVTVVFKLFDCLTALLRRLDALVKSYMTINVT